MSMLDLSAVAPSTGNYKPLFVIAVEGDVTEVNYFNFIQQKLDEAVVSIEIVPPKTKSAPIHVLQKLKDKKIQNIGKVGTFFYWMVIDRDKTKQQQITTVVNDCKTEGFGLCVSNPAFEYWLLLHFEDGNGVVFAETSHRTIGRKECSKRLRQLKYLPGFDNQKNGKKLKNTHCISLWDKRDDAVKRANQQDTPPCPDYPRNKCGTTIYRLVKELLRYT
ncbi:hypothetical protein FACS189427_08060 [Planctomycetales bacterium]|nr:hypothetical protein FACS189427_08060 [Planctomycetales bacterium]